MSDQTIIDSRALERLQEWGGAKLQRQMMRLFLEHSPERMDQIRDGLWIIPIAEYKTRRKIKAVPPVPLIPQAVAILDRRQERPMIYSATPFRPNKSDWVFPSPITDGPIENDKAAWKWVRARAGLDHVTFHGLRHTMGTWQGQGGTNQKLIADSLGHKNVATTERYVHGDMETIRANMAKAIDASFEVVQDDLIYVGLAADEWADVLRAVDSDDPLYNMISEQVEKEDG